ncbi:hypothetical protein [Muricoccus radiodurans]|uniref:hypothetical protein n=1 Tax=Muricoccus radiodurans TaxID=2231721 RepID=UPI003CEC900D
MQTPQDATPAAEHANVCLTDNESLARWLVAEYVSHFGAWRDLPGLKALQFRQIDDVGSDGDAITRYGETVRAGDMIVALEWAGLGQPFCFALKPPQSATGQHHMPSLFVGCEKAMITVIGQKRSGVPVPRKIAGHRIPTAMLAFSETWIRG